MLATIILAAAVPALATGTFHYSASYDGAPTGNSSVVVRRLGDTTTIQESATATLNGMPLSADATLTVGADLAPTLYNGSYQNNGLQMVVNATVTPTSATLVDSSSEGRPMTFPLKDGATHIVVIEPGLMAGLFALPAQMQAWQDAPILAVAPGMEKSIRVVVDQSAKPQRPSDVPATDLSLSIGGSIPFTMWYDPATLVPDEIIVPSQNAVVTRVK